MAGSLGLILLLNFLTRTVDISYSTILFNVGTNETTRIAAKKKEHCTCVKRLGKGFGMPFSVVD